MAIGFEGLVEMLKKNREQPSIEDEELANNQCPFCDIKLKVNERGDKACLLCGRIYK